MRTLFYDKRYKDEKIINKNSLCNNTLELIKFIEKKIKQEIIIFDITDKIINVPCYLVLPSKKTFKKWIFIWMWLFFKC